MTVAAVATAGVLTAAAVDGGAEASAPRATSSWQAGLSTAFAHGRHKPTIVLVHGAWADASSWSGEVERLQRAGFVVRAIPNPVSDLLADAQLVKNFLRSIEGPIVLVGHSYGGAVITNAAAGVENVKALVFVDAVTPDVGETNLGLVGAESSLNTHPAGELYDTIDYPGAPAEAKQNLLTEHAFVDYFASDLRKSRAKELWAEQRGADDPAFGTPTKNAAWRSIPSWAFVSTGDKIITPASKLAMAKRAHSVTTVYRGGSHLSLISHPNAVTAVIARAVVATR